MANTVRGTFDLSTPAKRKAALLRGELERTDAAAEKLGRTLDTLGSRTVRPKVELGGEREARGQIGTINTRLTKLGNRSVRPHVDVTGIETALAKVELLHRRVNALGRERATARIGVGGGSGLAAIESGANRAGAALGNAGRGARVFGLGMRTIAASATLALPAINALIGSVGALGGVLGGAGLGAGAVGIAGGAALLTGVGGVASVAGPLRKRIQAVTKAQAGVRTATSAQAATASSTTGLNAQRRAQDQVRASQQALTNSQWQASQAQQDLTRARRDARRALVDLQLAEDRGVLGQRRARIELTQARESLQQKLFDPTATPADLASARLGVSEARLGIKEAGVTRRRSRTDFTQARRQGINRNPQVVQAEHAVTQAAQSTRDAVRQVRESAAGLREAQQGVATGTSSIARSRAALSRALRNAPEGLTQLISEARRFKSEWNNATMSAQTNLVGFLRTTVRAGRTMIPTASRVASITTGAATREARGAESFITSSQTRQFALTSARMFDENLRPVRLTAQNVASSVMNISRASRPFLREGTAFTKTWTKGWADSTSDITKTRKTVGGMVQDLKAGWRFGASSFRLVRDVLNQGRPSGRGMLDTGTKFLDRLDRQVRRNPAKVRAFFRDTVDSTVRMARGIGDIAHSLFNIGQELQPVLKRFSDLIHLLSGAGLLGSPGALAGILGGVAAYRGRGVFGGRTAGGVGRGGGGGMPMIVPFGGGGAGGRAGGRGGWRMTPEQIRRGGGLPYGMLPVGAGRPSRLGRLGGAARGAGRAALPVAALFALASAAQGGLSAADRPAAALSSLSFGLIPAPTTQGSKVQGSARAAQAAIARLSRDPTRRAQQLAYLRAQTAPGEMTDARSERLIRMRRRAGVPLNAVPTTSGGEKGLAAAHTVIIQAQRATIQEGKAQSQSRGLDAASGIQAAFGIQRRGRGGLEGAITRTNRNVIAKMKALGPEGRKALGVSMLSWEREQAKRHPKLIGQYNDLKRQIVRQWRAMGSDVRIINGQIFDGSKRQWNAIGKAMTDPQERALEETHRNFTKIQQQAVNALRSMGFTSSEAKKVVAGMEKGGQAAAGAKASVKAGATSQLNRGPGRSSSKARGGRIAGRGTQDTVSIADNTLAAPGELIVNSHSERRINARLAAGGQSTTIGAEVSHESRKHSHAPRRGDGVSARQKAFASPALRRYLNGQRISAHKHALGGRVQRFATGGRSWGTRGPGNSLPQSQMTAIGGQYGGGQSIHPMIAGQVRSLTKQHRMLVSAGWAPVGTHAGNSDHHWGGATDLEPGQGGSWNEVDKVAKWAEPTQGSPAHGFRWVGYDGDPNHGRGNHLHLSWTFGKLIQGLAGGRGGGLVSAAPGGKAISLTAPRSRLPGVPGALSTRAGQIYAQGLQAKINRKIGARHGGAAAGGKLGPKGGGRTVGATTFGGPHDPGTGSSGYRGDNLYKHPDSYAELDMGRALGGLPYLHPLRVTGPRGSKVLRKRDIGLGGGPIAGHHRGIDLWFQAAQDLAGSDVWSGAVKVAELARGGRIPRHAGAFRRGTSFITRPGRAVQFTAGEGGTREAVDVRPLTGPGSNQTRTHSGGGHTISLTVDMRGAVITSKEHAEQIAEAAANKAAEKLVAALDRHGARDR